MRGRGKKDEGKIEREEEEKKREEKRNIADRMSQVRGG